MIQGRIAFFLFWILCSSQLLAEAPTSIRIGGPFALSGMAAPWGEADRNGATLALEEFKRKGKLQGMNVELIVEDIQSESSKAVTAVQKLLHIDKVQFIIGPTWADSFAGPLPLLERSEIVSISPSASISAMRQDQDFKYLFGTWYRTRDESKEVLAHLEENGLQSIALMFGNDPYWQEIAEQLKELAPAAGIEIVREINKAHTDTDFKTELIRLRALKAQAIIFGFDNEQGLLSFLRQRSELVPDIPSYTTEVIESYARQEAYAHYFTAIKYVTPQVENERFKAVYRERFKVEPMFGAANSYDAMSILLGGLVEGHTTASGMRSYMLNHTFDTVAFGEVSFAADQGLQGGNFVIKEATRKF